jgi:hypothetical protein
MVSRRWDDVGSRDRVGDEKTSDILPLKLGPGLGAALI